MSHEWRNHPSSFFLEIDIPEHPGLTETSNLAIRLLYRASRSMGTSSVVTADFPTHTIPFPASITNPTKYISSNGPLKQNQAMVYPRIHPLSRTQSQRCFIAIGNAISCTKYEMVPAAPMIAQ